MNKYKIIPEQYLTITNEEGRDVQVHRIVATRTFRKADGEIVVKGAEGGFVESYGNLSQQGSCWVSGNAIVMGTGYVAGDTNFIGNVVLNKGTLNVNYTCGEWRNTVPMRTRKPGEEYTVEENGEKRMLKADGTEYIETGSALMTKAPKANSGEVVEVAALLANVPRAVRPLLPVGLNLAALEVVLPYKPVREDLIVDVKLPLVPSHTPAP